MKWRFRFVKDTLKATFSRGGKHHEHDYDVSELGDYVNEQSTEIIEDLINEGNLKSKMRIMPNVKGKELIKLINSNPSLQAANACGWTPEGGMILTDTTIETVRVKIQEEYCNENLNETWAEVMNAVGANAQDETPPSFADGMLLYYQMRAQEMDEDLIMNGDTDSLDGNLAHYDGFVKLWDADSDLNVASSTENSIDGTNAFDIMTGFVAAIPTIVKRHKDKVKSEIICGFETAQFVLDQIYADKDYASSIEVTRGNGELSFILPTTNVTIRSIVQLDGTEKVYGVCYAYMFYATDLENDKDGFTWKYSDYEEKLRFGVKWRCGIQYVFPEYFTRLELAAS